MCNAKCNNSHQEVFANFGVKYTSRLNVNVHMNVGLYELKWTQKSVLLVWIMWTCGHGVCFHCPLCLVVCKNGDLVDLMIIRYAITLTWSR